MPPEVAARPRETGYRVSMPTVQSALEAYFWDGKDYAVNAVDLQRIAADLQEASRNLSNPDGKRQFRDAVRACLEWGLMPEAARKNLKWYDALKDHAAQKVLDALAILEDDYPPIEGFGASPGSLRMNSGYMKVYALLSDRLIIYDGRVGAALATLVRRFLGGHPLPVPEELEFAVCPQHKKRQLTGFSRLDGYRDTSKAGMVHAECARRASWILAEGKRLSASSPGAQWCQTLDGLRRLEAALLMLSCDVCDV
jgi:hypothetical protein